MTKPTKTEIMSRYQDLPEDLQKALASTAFPDAMIEISKKEELNVEKMGELADETGLVMLGFTPPGEFIKNLGIRLEIPPEKARSIAESVNQKIFQPVRESLKKIHGLGAEKPPPPPQPPAPKPAVKPLPVKEEIKKPENIQKKVEAIFEEIEEKKNRKYAPGLPPIFAKNIPLPAEAEKTKDSLEADLEKKLVEAKKAQPNIDQKSRDPYREPIEP